MTSMHPEWSKVSRGWFWMSWMAAPMEVGGSGKQKVGRKQNANFTYLNSHFRCASDKLQDSDM